MAQCLKCHRSFREPTDEVGDHGCLRCGSDITDLHEGVRDYVNSCVEIGVEPSGYVYCVMERIDYASNWGTMVDEYIADEMRDHEANAEVDG